MISAQRTNTINNNNAAIDNNKTKHTIYALTFRDGTLYVNVSHPSYWNVSQDNDNNNIISLTSPLKTVGVKFVTIPFVNVSLEEFTANRILALKDNLMNFNVIR